MERRERASSGIHTSTFCRKVKLTGADGKTYTSDAVGTEAAFRVIQSIPSPKDEPFKRWLARVGYDRVPEIEDPNSPNAACANSTNKRATPAPGSTIAPSASPSSDKLTGECKNRGVEGHNEFAILTAEISKATFGATPPQYKNRKGLQRGNLRGHTTDPQSRS